MIIEELFFELIQVAIGQRERLSRILTNKEWAKLYAMSFKQSLVGVAFYGVEKLPKEQWPAQVLLFQWIGDVTAIENQNKLTSRACQDLCIRFENDGFQCCILKGQANHAYYPSELRNRRACGDIDVWTCPIENGELKIENSQRKVLEYLKRKYKLTGLCWLHANITHKSGVPVEVHFYPSFMNSPTKNRRFLKYFYDIKECTCLKDIDGIKIPAMKIECDVVYQMNHIYSTECRQDWEVESIACITQLLEIGNLAAIVVHAQVATFFSMENHCGFWCLYHHLSLPCEERGNSKTRTS